MTFLSCAAVQHPIRFSLSLAGTAALALALLPFDIRPVTAQEAPAPAAEPKAETNEAADLGVMGVSLKDAVKFNWGFQGALQGAGTPNQAGVGAFVPLKVNQSSVWFLDALVNANLSDYSGLSSIGDTKVAGTTISTSTRVGYRWLNSNRSWMYGINAGYDSRPMATGPTDNGFAVTNSQTVFFQQVALNAEAKSNKWSLSAYGLFPIGETASKKGVNFINSAYGADPLTTVGLEIGYAISPALKLEAGYYYQRCQGDDIVIPPNGFNTGLTYEITDQLQASVVYSYDGNFQSRISGDLKWRFGIGSTSKKKTQPLPVSPVIQALTATPRFRNVRVANFNFADLKMCAHMQLDGGGTDLVCWLEEMPNGKSNGWSSVIFRESGGVYINKCIYIPISYPTVIYGWAAPYFGPDYNPLWPFPNIPCPGSS